MRVAVLTCSPTQASSIGDDICKSFCVAFSFKLNTGFDHRTACVRLVSREQGVITLSLDFRQASQEFGRLVRLSLTFGLVALSMALNVC
jgi:hypothetical protein